MACLNCVSNDSSAIENFLYEKQSFQFMYSEICLTLAFAVCSRESFLAMTDAGSDAFIWPMIIFLNSKICCNKIFYPKIRQKEGMLCSTIPRLISGFPLAARN